MSPDEKRIAIAEACGWKRVEMKDTPTRTGKYPSIRWVRKEHRPPQKHLSRNAPPNYLKDLNVMREAEQTLFGGEWKRYVNALVDIKQTPEDAIFASAEQRAEAFLRVKGFTP